MRKFPARVTTHKTFTLIVLATFLACLSVSLSAQQEQGMFEHATYMRAAIIEHHGASATVQANQARPLEQAIRAISEEYGWDVHYEDPLYQGKRDLSDMTNPSYRAEHPDARFVPGPSGGAFQSTYPETLATPDSAAQEELILKKIVADYNQSCNPGHFVVRTLADGSFDVVGDGIHDDNGALLPFTPVLDTPVSIPLETRTLGGTFHAIMDAVSAKVGMKLGGVASIPGNGVLGSAKTFGSPTPTPARDLLMQLVAGHKFQMTLLCEPPPIQSRFLLMFRQIHPAKFNGSR